MKATCARIMSVSSSLSPSPPTPTVSPMPLLASSLGVEAQSLVPRKSRATISSQGFALGTLAGPREAAAMSALTCSAPAQPQTGLLALPKLVIELAQLAHKQGSTEISSGHTARQSMRTCEAREHRTLVRPDCSTAHAERLPPVPRGTSWESATRNAAARELHGDALAPSVTSISPSAQRTRKAGQKFAAGKHQPWEARPSSAPRALRTCFLAY